jgi:hypothetical protein
VDPKARLYAVNTELLSHREANQGLPVRSLVTNLTGLYRNLAYIKCQIMYSYYVMTRLKKNRLIPDSTLNLNVSKLSPWAFKQTFLAGITKMKWVWTRNNAFNGISE